MPKFRVTGYLVTPYSVEVEAEDADTAQEIGVDLIENEDKGEQGEPEFQPEYDTEEIED
jgi:hypothetical protein